MKKFKFQYFILCMSLVYLFLGCKDDTIDCDCEESAKTDTMCVYKSVVLDLDKRSSFSYDDLIGNWEVVCNAKIDSCVFVEKPDSVKKTMNVNFLDSKNISGHTEANDFDATYVLNNCSISINIGRMTLVLEAYPWFPGFYDALSNSDYITIKDKFLIIYYDDSQKAIILSKDN